MQYAGFLLQYTMTADGSIKFEGPFTTIEQATKKYEDLALLEPAVSKRRIVRIVSGATPDWK